jgi:5-formyltetrahydrofolate cyclo-ligase
VSGVHGVDGPVPRDPISKSRLRSLALGRARLRPAGERAAASAAVQRALISSRWWLQADLLLCYLALPTEVQTAGLLEAARARGLPVAAPRVSGDSMRFHVVERDGRELAVGPLGVREPPPDAPVLDLGAVGRLLVVVPGLVFDVHGCRVGRGGGHYDRFLAMLRPRAVTVGLCFDDALLDRVPRDPWDVPVDIVVTEARGALDCRRAGQE